MQKNRVEAFSDGVIAIVITIMVLELKVPHATDWAALAEIVPSFLTYVLSFMYVAIYWSNHHHLLHTVSRVSALILWANLHLLFWIALIPFTTAWMGENNFDVLPTAVYGFVLLMAAMAYFLLERAIIHDQGINSSLAKALGAGTEGPKWLRLLGLDVKGKISLALYAVAIASAFYSPLIADAIYAAVAMMWIVPDRRIEKALGQ